MKNPQVEVKAYLDEKVAAANAMGQLYLSLLDDDCIALGREGTAEEEAYAQRITAQITPAFEQDLLYDAMRKAITQIVDDSYTNAVVSQKNRIRRRLRSVEESGVTDFRAQNDYADGIVERFENIASGVELTVVYADFLTDDEIQKLQAPWIRIFGEAFPIPEIITER
jgi:uncharacterized membrane protein YgcG